MNLRFFNKTRSLFSKSIWSTCIRIFLFIIYPFMICQHIVTISKVASGSMTPTILTHDFVLMMRYNLTVGDFFSMLIPFIGELFTNSDSKLIKNLPFLMKPLIIFRDIKYGDIITFTIPGDPSVYTKRIIGKSNDVVQYFYGKYYINNKPLLMSYDGRIELYENNKSLEGDTWLETDYTGSKTYTTLKINGMGLQNDISDKFYVPNNHYFVSGDNRDMSDDGRSMLCFIPHYDIKFRVVANIFSNAQFTTLYLAEWFKGIRYKYTLTLV